jgi:predicted anti-sigma-YlaC factor YlaD
VNADDHRAVRELLGAYVLGQLDDAERTRVQAHVDGCPACQAEIAELAPLAPALRRVDPGRLGALPSPPPDLGEAVLQRVREGRRDRNRGQLLRRSAAGLLVAAALVGAFFLGVRQAPTPTAALPVVPLSVRVDVDGVQADAGLVKHTWGTELQLEATGLENGGAYTVTFTRTDGTEVAGGTFLGTGANPLRCSLNAALPIDDAAAVRVNDAGGALVLDADVA